MGEEEGGNEVGRRKGWKAVAHTLASWRVSGLAAPARVTLLGTLANYFFLLVQRTL